MKKVIGILGVAVMATGIFVTTNNVTSTNAPDLTSLVGLTPANAELGNCLTCGLVSYDVCVTVDYHQYIGYRVFFNC
jgi:hypothetical protein